MVGSSDPLQCGLEVFAMPPGKKMGTLSLLSGGEKTMTAAALILAVFLQNTSPLCVLDEGDAPLDDVNIEKYCNVIKKINKENNEEKKKQYSATINQWDAPSPTENTKGGVFFSYSHVTP